MEPAQLDFRAYYGFLFKEAKAKSDADYIDWCRFMCLNDTFFLLRYGCEMDFLGNAYAFNRCRQVDEIEFKGAGGLNNWLFLWLREGYKSTILNLGKNLQHGLRDPNKSTLIMSNTSPGAKLFLGAIKQTLENSKRLHSWFPDIIPDPDKKNRSWSLNDGLCLIRTSNQKEPTYMASGLVDGQPTKVHCDYLNYDDVVTKDSVETTYMIEKTDEAFYLSFMLGKSLDGSEGIKWSVGTIYHHLDTNNKIRSKPDWRVSELKWHTGDGKTPRAHTIEKIAELRRMMSPYAFASQMELNPVPDEDRRFQCGIKHYDSEPAKHWNFVLLCDPAGEGKKLRDHKADYTAMWVVGRDDHGKEYVVDGVYDRMPLEQRAHAIFGPKGFVRKWNIDEIWYERVGAAADISTLKTKMEQVGLNITIHEYNPGAHGKKQNRIEGALMNRFSDGRMLFPRKLMYQTLDGPTIDLVQVVLKEIAEFPRGEHDDALDGLAQIDVVPAYGRPGMLKSPDAPLYETREEFDRLFHPELETETAGAMELI